MKKLKIGLFMDDFYPSVNGVVLVIDNYAKKLLKYADVTVVVPITASEYVDNFPYKVIRVKSFKMHVIDYSFAKPLFDKKLEELLIAEKFDIIHIHSPFIMGYLGIHIGKLLNIPVIATMHTQFYLEFKRYTKSSAVSTLFTKIIITIFNSCYKCFAVNENVAKIFLEYGAKELPGVISNGTDLKLVSNGDEADNNINKKYNIKPNEIVFLFLGRINVLKNILFIVDVLDYLKNQNLKFKMMFVGTLEDYEILRNRIAKYHLEDDVIITGKIMDRKIISDIYHRASLFLFPSLYDASSLVQIEAASQKLPTVFIEGSATSCSVVDNQNGFLAKNDVKEYGNRIIEILNNKELYDKVSEGAYKEIYKSWDELAIQLFDLYNSIINKYNNK